MIKLGIGGALGRMGQTISKLAKTDPTFEIMLEVTRDNPLQNAQNMDVFIDFSTKEGVLNHLPVCVQRQCPMVIGVTGFDARQKSQIEQASKQIPIVFSPNMSLGVNISYTVLALLGEILKGKAEVSIHEIHHQHKKDKPSGTALRMQSVLNESLRTTVPVPVTSDRIGDVMGEHVVTFKMPGEQLEINHKVISRDVFAHGSLAAAKWLVNQVSGLYDMQDVLGLKVSSHSKQ